MHVMALYFVKLKLFSIFINKKKNLKFLIKTCEFTLLKVSIVLKVNVYPISTDLVVLFFPEVSLIYRYLVGHILIQFIGSSFLSEEFGCELNREIE
jgi:hypothetical protein